MKLLDLYNQGTWVDTYSNVTDLQNQISTSLIALDPIFNPVYTISFYAKAGTANYIGIGTYQSANYGIIVNLTNGTFSANISNPPASYAITSVGNSWYRCSITINSVQASSSAFYIIMSEDGTSTSFICRSKIPAETSAP